MNEIKAKTKLCMKNLQMARLIALLQTATGDMDAEAIATELKLNSFCAGSECGHWAPDLVKEEKGFDKSPPDNEGWEKLARVPGQVTNVWYRWVEADTGCCGLISQPFECNASCG